MIGALSLVILVSGAVIQAGDQSSAFERTTFCGVVTTYRADSPPQCDLRLTVRAPDATTMTVSVRSVVRAKLQPRAEELFQQDVCASGAALTRDGEPLLALDDPSQIRITARRDVAPFGAGAVDPCVDDVTLPRLIHETKPLYTGEAMRARVQGVIRMTIVVGADGAVRDVRVLEGLHPDLDAGAVETVRQWTFRPGRQNGAPVPVIVSVEMAFSLGRRK